MATLKVQAHENNFGACVEGIDLSQPISAELAETLHQVWYQYQVIYFPNQPLTPEQLERFTAAIGPFGTEPYLKTLPNYEHIVEIRREPDEPVAPFGASWHSDWSFRDAPPSATILYSQIVPPVGGYTHYADGIRAFETLDPVLAAELEEMQAVHSARRSYSLEGYKRSGGEQRSVAVEPNDNAMQTKVHPVVRTHPKSGRKVLWINPVYTLSIEGLSQSDSDAMLKKLYGHALDSQFIYAHRWAANMLTMWDNRSVQHCAQGGYDGHRRVMLRTTVAGDVPF